MRIAWFWIPAHGHTNPTLGLVKKLTEAEHQVWYFSFEEFREKIESAGATFVSCDGYDFEMEDKDNADRVGKDNDFRFQSVFCEIYAGERMGYRQDAFCHAAYQQAAETSAREGISGEEPARHRSKR